MNAPGTTARRGASVLAVDRNPRNLALLSPFLEREGYRVRATGDYEALDRVLDSADLPSLALVDLAGFDGGIWERCERLRRARVPIIVVSPKKSALVQQESRLHGARAVVIRPIIMKHLLALIRTLIGS